MVEQKINGSDEDIPGHRILDGTDLEIAYNLRGDDLVLRINKSDVQVFRVLLEGACKNLEAGALMSFNAISPDFVLKIGDTQARMLQVARGIGLDAEQLAKLEAKLEIMTRPSDVMVAADKGFVFARRDDGWLVSHPDHAVLAMPRGPFVNAESTARAVLVSGDDGKYVLYVPNQKCNTSRPIFVACEF